MFTKQFWKDAGERAGKTFAQAILAVFLVSGVTVMNANWVDAVALGATAALVSVLTSVVSTVKTDPSGQPTASLVSSAPPKAGE